MLTLHTLLHQARLVASLAVLGGACTLALPAHALQTGAPAGPPPAGARAAITPEALGLNAAQARLLTAARTATREAHAHALELRARLIREQGEDAPDAPLRPRLVAADRLHDAIEQERRVVRERWLALDDSLDAAQRARLRASPEAAHWLGLPPPPMPRAPGQPMPPGPMAPPAGMPAPPATPQ